MHRTACLVIKHSEKMFILYIKIFEKITKENIKITWKNWIFEKVIKHSDLIEHWNSYLFLLKDFNKEIVKGQ